MFISDINGFKYYIVLKNIQYIRFDTYGTIRTLVFANNEEIDVSIETYKEILKRF